ncbi:glycosyltransferase [Comamonas testosteroni]|uniref:glycosyltransferase n=1 Tax=Comamonas testosteroni TaxID=285 RepID=UPI0015F82A7F|nr:glycosyltransferase [Comamonas testosteroni]
MSNSELMQGNSAFRQKNYKAAIEHYMRAKAINPELAHLMSGNIELAKRRIGAMPAPDKNRVSSVDVVVPVYNALEDVQKCLASLQRNTDGFNVRIIVVNDGSEKDTTQWLREFCNGKPLFQLIEHAKNSGYTKAVNTGLKASNADYAVTKNIDTIVSKGWLMGLIRCMESAPSIGIVGPLSNAASWQNVPNLHDETGAFAVNEIPNGYSVDEMAELVRSASTRVYPRLPFANGFCFMIKKAVLDRIGFMDEENFPVGYGEENDFCIRAIDAGFEIVIADDTYVFHAKSKSFGHEKRKKLSQEGTESLKRKHSAEKYFSRVSAVKKTDILDEVRARLQERIREKTDKSKHLDLMDMRVLYLLPVKGGGGGAHSVVQEVAEMRRLGFNAKVGVKNEHLSGFHQNYEIIPGAIDMFEGFSENSILKISENYDVVIGTIFSSMRLVKKIVEVNPHIMPAYYVQDYEPLFSEEGSEKWKEAFDSYDLVPNAFLFAKTKWIIDEVQRHHASRVHKVSPSIDHAIYKPAVRQSDEKLHIAVMIRPQTPRRGADRSMRVLSRLHQKYPGKLNFLLFGCAEDDAAFQALQRDFPYVCYGSLKREQVAELLGKSDLFLDFSDYQAFGRTALEAMACGCAAMVPVAGGADEYAVDGINSIVVDTLDEERIFNKLSELIDSGSAKIEQMKHQGLLTAARYSVHQAAVSEYVPIFAALKMHRVENPVVIKSKLILLPALRSDGLPAKPGYVRLVLPFNSKEVLREWSVEVSEDLPVPGSANIVVIQRDAASWKLAHLKEWLQDWRKAGGKLIYDIDDDLMDIEGVHRRGFNMNPQDTLEKISFLAKNANLVTTSSPSLVEQLNKFNNNVLFVPSRLDGKLWHLGQKRDHSKGPYACKEGDPVRIGYIGTPEHNADLDVIVEAMQMLQRKFGSKIEIEVIGGFQKLPATFGKRVGLPKKNDYPSFVKWLQQRVHWDIGIVPMIDDGFNRSKSSLKFLEYSALDMAIVVSDCPAFNEVAKNNVNCISVKNEAEKWVDALTRLILDKSMRDSMKINGGGVAENSIINGDCYLKLLNSVSVN